MSKQTVKNMFSPSEKVVSPKGKVKAQQQFKGDADINTIMKKFQKTGAIDHVSQYQPAYGLATAADLHTMMNIVANAQSMFEALPSSLRTRFENKPDKFLEFVQNPDNAAEAAELGLALSPEAQSQADALTAEIANNPPATEPDPEPAPDPTPTA